MSELASNLPGVNHGEMGRFMDFAIGEAVTSPVDVRDEAACFQLGRRNYGAQWEGLVDDARRAVASLGDGVCDYLNSTGAGNDPAVVAALAQWQRGTSGSAHKRPGSV